VRVLLLLFESLTCRRRFLTLSLMFWFDEYVCRDGKDVERLVIWYLVWSVCILVVCLLEQMLLLLLEWLLNFGGGRTEGNWSTKVKVSMLDAQLYPYVLKILWIPIKNGLSILD